jgi:hypothetical protein
MLIPIKYYNIASNRTKLSSCLNTFSSEDRLFENYSVRNSILGPLLAMKIFGGVGEGCSAPLFRKVDVKCSGVALIHTRPFCVNENSKPPHPPISNEYRCGWAPDTVWTFVD